MGKLVPQDTEKPETGGVSCPPDDAGRRRSYASGEYMLNRVNSVSLTELSSGKS